MQPAHTLNTPRQAARQRSPNTRFESLVTIDGNNGYNFELTDDFKKAIKQAADDVEAYKLRNQPQKGAHAAAPAAANTAHSRAHD